MIFSRTLIDWYLNNKRNLPWRETANPYYIWLSEIILQQTQVKQGLPYYIDFVTQFPTIEDLAHTNENNVLKLWQGLGYYSRARNLYTTAIYIVNNLNGEFPNTFSELLKLKGVGDYTASAIASICFNEPTAVVDGNVYRVLSRYFGIHTPINTTSGFKEFKALAQKLINVDRPAEFNQAIMEFGATQCKPKSPDCNICPLNSNCIALQQNLIEKLPVKIKANKVKKKYFNYIVILSENNKTILEQRKGKGIWENLYQFPLIETKKTASNKEIELLLKDLETLKNSTFEVSLYNTKEIIHKLSHQHLHTKFWIITLKNSIKKGIPIATINKYPVPTLISNFIKSFNF
jgi:A/G-specific adenine glycosylase